MTPETLKDMVDQDLVFESECRECGRTHHFHPVSMFGGDIGLETAVNMARQRLYCWWCKKRGTLATKVVDWPRPEREAS